MSVDSSKSSGTTEHFVANLRRVNGLLQSVKTEWEQATIISCCMAMAESDIRKMCAKCGKPATTACVKCKAVYYCDRQCQVADWKSAGHFDEDFDNYLADAKQAAIEHSVDISGDAQDGKHKNVCERLKQAVEDRSWSYHHEYDMLGIEFLDTSNKKIPQTWTQFFGQSPKMQKYLTRALKVTKSAIKVLGKQFDELNSLPVSEESLKRCMSNSMSAPLTILHALQQTPGVLYTVNANKPKPIHVVVAGANSWCELNSADVNKLRYGILEQYLPKGRTLYLEFIGPEVPDELICERTELTPKVSITCKKEAYTLEEKPDLVVIMNPGLHSDYYESWMMSLKPVFQEKIPMVICTWNFYEELGPTVMHLTNGAKEMDTELVFDIKENPFRSLVYRQHDKRPNNIRCSNWTFVRISYAN